MPHTAPHPILSSPPSFSEFQGDLDLKLKQAMVWNRIDIARNALTESITSRKAQDKVGFRCQSHGRIYAGILTPPPRYSCAAARLAEPRAHVGAEAQQPSLCRAVPRARRPRVAGMGRALPFSKHSNPLMC